MNLFIRPNVRQSLLKLISSTIRLKTTRLSCVLLLVGVSHTTLAKDYIVEIILFENSTQSSVTEPHAYEAPEKPRTNAQAWLLDTQLLTDQAEKLDSSEDFDLRHHFAWGQESLPYSKSATYTVIEPDTKGYIKVYADQLLFANIDIDYKGFRMVEKRRLKLNERHYFDHPKFGILMQVSRLQAKPADDHSQSNPLIQNNLQEKVKSPSVR